MTQQMLIDGVMRPLTNAAGLLIHPELEGISNFWRWNADGALVDESGRPLVLYHGTNQPIDSFSRDRLGASTFACSATKGFFFTDHQGEAAQYAELAATKVIHGVVEHERLTEDYLKRIERAERVRNWDLAARLTEEMERHEFGGIYEGGHGANIMPVYLRMRNPRIEQVNGSISTGGVAILIDEAKGQGFDGLVLCGIEDSPNGGVRSNHYVAFSESQIKSALGNSGQFNLDSASIVDTIQPEPVHKPTMKRIRACF